MISVPPVCRAGVASPLTLTSYKSMGEEDWGVNHDTTMLVFRTTATGGTICGGSPETLTLMMAEARVVGPSPRNSTVYRNSRVLRASLATLISTLVALSVIRPGASTATKVSRPLGSSLAKGSTTSVVPGRMETSSSTAEMR